MGKLSHNNLFRAGSVRYVAIALVLAVSLSLISAPRAAAQSIGDYFDISYDPVELSQNVIHGDEIFYATIRGHVTCKQNLPMTVSEAIVTSRVVAEHEVNGTTKTLNSSYTVTIEPFPDEAGETYPIEKVIPLQFPGSSESGNYEVIGELIQAKVKVSIFWYDVTEYLSQSQVMGSVEYIAPEPPAYYTLTINVSGQGTTNPSPGTRTYNEGTEVTITAYPASGWAFDHWSGTNNNDLNPTTVTMNSNKTVTAYFDEAVADIFSYYRGLDGDPTDVSDGDLLQAAYDWAHHVILSGFTTWLTDTELLQLAYEWATDTPQIVPVSLTTTGEDTTVHIANIDMGLTSTWWGWHTYATATVSIADARGNPMAGATVSGHWEGATSDTGLGETDSQGRVQLSSNAVWKVTTGTRFAFTVDNVAKSGWTYNPDDNIETTDSIVKESSGFFSSIWLIIKGFTQSLRSKPSGSLRENTGFWQPPPVLTADGI